MYSTGSNLVNWLLVNSNKIKVIFARTGAYGLGTATVLARKIRNINGEGQRKQLSTLHIKNISHIEIGKCNVTPGIRLDGILHTETQHKRCLQLTPQGVKV